MKKSLQEINFLDVAWLKDRSVADFDNHSDPCLLAFRNAGNLEGALHGFKIIKQLKT